MAKLNQVIAVEKGAKKAAEDDITIAYRRLQHAELFNGLIRQYAANDDENGENLPGESQKVQAKADDVVSDFVASQTALFDTVATKEYANTKAHANVVVDDVTILANVPVTYLLFLEKRLALTLEFLSKIPVLDPALDWDLSANDGLYHAVPVITNRSKKVPRTLIKAPATDKHPAQVDVFTEDEIVGKWTTTKLSGATLSTTVAEWKAKVTKLAEAVKFAREEANTADAAQQSTGKPVFDFIFG